MSLDAMTERALATPREREQRQSGTALARGAEAIVTYIPIEIVLVYVAAVAAIRDPGEAPSTGQWVLLVVILVLTPVATWAVYALKVTARGGPAPVAPWQWPWPEMLVASLGLLLWAFAVPHTPFEQFDWYRAGLSAVVLLVGTLVLGLLGPVLRRLDAASDSADPTPVDTRRRRTAEREPAVDESAE